MTTIIKAPVQDFTGSTYIGPTVLDFKDGQATTDVELKPGTLAYLAKRGYKVEGADAGPSDPLDGLTVAELRQHAEDHGIDLGGATRKADILAVIRNAEGGDDQ